MLDLKDCDVCGKKLAVDADFVALRYQGEIKRLRTELWKARESLSELEVCEARYRLAHDLHGASHINTGHAWDQLRHAGDGARESLRSIEESGVLKCHQE